MSGDKKGRLEGELTLLGTTKPVTFDFMINQVGPHPLPQYKDVVVAGFSARGTIKRSEFGMTKFLPALGDEVELWFEVEAHKQ
jgi:polyisoprenoid-binding protein YceI